MIRAGTLDRTVDLLELTTTSNAYGEEIITPTVLATVQAQKLTLRAADMQRAQLHSVQLDGKFTIRWRDDVTTKMRLRYDGTDYEIVSVEEIGRRRGLTLMVRVG